MSKFAIGLLTLPCTPGYCYDHAGQGRDEQQRAYPETQKALAIPRWRTLVCRSGAGVCPAVQSGRPGLPGNRPKHRLQGVASPI
jgi:hypothetical protein